MRLVVPDASAVLDYLLGTDAGERVRDVVRLPDIDLHVPALCDVEVVSGLRRGTLRGRLSIRRATEALGDYLDLPLHRHGHASLLGRMLDLRANLSAYDASYAALAEAIGAELLTTDQRLVRAVTAHTAIRTLP